MWALHQLERFEMAHNLKNRGDYKASLGVANSLLDEPGLKPELAAYVQGCIVAVDLRHLGELAAAEEAFSKAYEAALNLNKVIAAYILNDWSSLHLGAEAITMIKDGLRLLDEADETPDPMRDLAADRAYFEATLARREVLSDNPESLGALRSARRALQKAAARLPKYKDAHFNALAWECEAAVQVKSVRYLASSLPFLIYLALRQGKMRLLIRYL